MMMIDLVMLGCPIGAVTAMKMSMVMSALGSVASFVGQSQAANRQQAYQNHLATLQKQAGDRKASAAIAANIQQTESTARKKQNIRSQAEKVGAEARLSTIEGGVEGLSVHYLLEEYEAQEGAYLYSLAEEQRMKNAELDRYLKDVHLSTEQQMASTNTPVNYPSALAAGLGTAASMYGKWGQMKAYEEESTDFGDPYKRLKAFGMPFKANMPGLPE